MMKRWMLMLLATGLIFQISDVQAASRKTDRRTMKILKDQKYRKNQEVWNTDLQTALSESAKSGKPIMLLVTGSTWCGPCKNLERNVLSSSSFKKYAQKNLVLLKADIPRSRNDMTPATQKIINKYHKGGVPAIYIIDSKGNVKEKQSGYGRGKTKDFLRRFKTLKAK